MEIMSIKIMNRIRDKGEPWRSPRSTRNEFNLLLVVPAMLVQGPICLVPVICTEFVEKASFL